MDSSLFSGGEPRTDNWGFMSLSSEQPWVIVRAHLRLLLSNFSKLSAAEHGGRGQDLGVRSQEKTSNFITSQRRHTLSRRSCTSVAAIDVFFSPCPVPINTGQSAG